MDTSQEIKVDRKEDCCLRYLRDNYKRKGLDGTAVVLIPPALIDDAYKLPGFVPVEKYFALKAQCDNEIGAVECFRVAQTN